MLDPRPDARSGSAPASPIDPIGARRGAGRALHLALWRDACAPLAIAAVGLALVAVIPAWVAIPDWLLNRGVPPGEAMRLGLLSAVPAASRVWPLAVLVALLVALGRMAADRELLALEASGVRALRLSRPALTFGAIMAVASLGLSLGAAPWAEREVDASLARVAAHQPWTPFRAGSVSRFGASRVEAREVSARGDELRGVSLWTPDVGETLFARQAHVARREDGGVELTLEDGSLLLPPRDGALELRFETLRASLPAADVASSRDGVGGQGVAALREAAHRFRPSPPQPVSRAAVELQRRLAQPAATLLFGLLALPLFLLRPLRSRASGALLGLVVSIGHLVLAQLGEGLMQAGVLGVTSGVWLPNAVVAGLVLALRFAPALPSGRPALGLWRGRAQRASAAEPRRHALPRAIAGRFVRLALLSFGVLLTAYLLIDVLERLDWFARHRASGDEVLRFYAARIWLLGARLVPLALLVGTALLVSLLALEGELVGMRACGISTLRAFAPVVALTVLVAPAYFLLRNEVLPRTNARADHLKQTEIKRDAYRALDEERRTAVWRRSGDRVFEAARFDPDRGVGVALTVYEIGRDGLPVSRSDASAAHHIGRGVWRLEDPRRLELREGVVREVAAAPYLELGEVLPAQVDTMHLSVGGLAEEIAAAEDAGYDATPLRVDLHVKLADTLACLVLPAAVLFFALSGPPFPGPARTLLASLALGVGWVLLTGTGAALGYGGAVSPALAGWAPPAGFGALTVFLALRTRR